MNLKFITIAIVGVVLVATIIGCLNGYIGQNDDQDWQVLQGIWGKMSTRTISGVYQKKFATAWTYPKVVRVYFSSDTKEGSAEDESCKVVFSDKGTATFSSMVLYNTPYLLAGEAIEEGTKVLLEGPVARFHRLTRGNIEISDKTILARLKEYARIHASTQTASECVENQGQFIDDIRKSLKEDSTLKSYGIDVDELALSDIVFDNKTLEMFEKQQDAILAAAEAEAKKIQYEMQELETIAEYAQKIAKEKGTAEMEMMKQTTDAERDKKLAEIDAAKNVAVALLKKEQAETIASQTLSVNLIEKEAALVVANKGLEVATIGALEAEQAKLATISAAEGKEKAIKLSGAITETVRVLAEIEADKEVLVASHLKDTKTPYMVLMGGNGEGGGMTMPLINIAIMKAAGVLPSDFSVTPANVVAPITAVAAPSLAPTE